MKAHLTGLATACLLALAPTAAFGQTSSDDAFAAGKSAGATAAVSASGQIGPASTNTLPSYYTATPDTSNAFNGSLGSVTAMGAQRVAQCANLDATADALTRQACSATSFIYQNAGTNTYQFSKKDPVIAASRQTVANAAPSAGSQAYQGCVTQTVTSPAKTTLEHCNEIQNSQNYSCSRILTVKVEPKWVCENPSVVANSSSWFDYSLRCPAPDSPVMTLTVGVSYPYQCHGGSCNSDYYNLVMSMAGGGAISASRSPIARTYDDNWWGDISASYDGHNTIAITSSSLREYLPGTCPDGTIVPPGGRSYSWWMPDMSCTTAVVKDPCPPDQQYQAYDWFSGGSTTACRVQQSTYCPAGYTMYAPYDPESGSTQAATCIASPTRVQYLTFTGGPRIDHSETDQWENQCADMEARSQ